MTEKKNIADKPAETYQDIIGNDPSGAPAFLAHAHSPDIGTEAIEAERYWCADFFKKENAFLWPRVWQMACLLDDIPEIGDLSLIHI